MAKYNPEDLVLWNEFAKAKRANIVRWPASHKYSLESSFTKTEKIETIDAYGSDHHEKILTYAINLVTEWDKEKVYLPVDKDGWIRTNSMKAWLHKNDPEKLADDYYRYGTFTICDILFNLCQKADQASTNVADDECIDKLFHNLCVKQTIAEECIYLERDPKAKKFGKLRSLLRTYDIFGTQMLCDFRYNLDSEEIEVLDEKLIDITIAKLEEFDKVCKNFNNDFVQIAKDANWRESI